MNKLDSELILSAFRDAGFLITDSVKGADVMLINTCSVRQHAEDRVLSHLGHLKHIKKTRPDLIVGVIGCMAQRLGENLLTHEAVDLVCGPSQIPQIVPLCEKAFLDKQKLLHVTPEIRQQAPDNPELEAFELIQNRDDQQIPGQAYVRIMRGCNNFCTYCIVPYVRGPEVSRPPARIIEQIQRLADTGVKQITLLGQTVNAYAYVQGEKTTCLADLLETASDIKGIEWIRFVTSYPSDQYFEPIMQAMASLPKVCNALHIPAQSGSDTILKAMNRHYTAQQYLALLNRARALIPDIALAGDFIVGFPGETEEDFKQTIDLVNKARYRNCYVFKYSPRPGTISDKRLQDTIPDHLKQQRNTILLSVQEGISNELSQHYQNQEVKVLVEGLSKKAHTNPTDTWGNPQLVGRTATDWIVVFHGPVSLAGEFTTVKIKKTSPLTLFGNLC